MENIEDYGACVNATPAQNKCAIEAAISTGDTVYIPEKPFVTDQICSNRVPLFKGDSGLKSQLISTSSTSAIRIMVEGDHIGASIKDIRITPRAAGQGTYALEFVMTPTGCFRRFNFEGLIIEEFGKQAICFDNSIGKVDAFFTGTITKSYLSKGFKGILIGDDVKITYNTITGGTLPGIFTTHLSGARKCEWANNSLSTRGGAVKAVNAEGLTITENQMEHPSYLGAFIAVNPTIDEGAFATIHLNGCKYTRVINNQISGGNGRPGPDGQPVAGAPYGILQQGASSIANFRNLNVFNTAMYAPVYDWQGGAGVDGGYNIFE